MAIKAPVPLRIEAREPSDLAGTLRFTNLAGGYDKRRAQETYREALEPMCYEAQNIDMWSREGQWFLCPNINQIGALDGTDREWLLITFNQAVYRFPTVGGVAADIVKYTQSPPAVPVAAAIANPYPGLLGIRNGVVWRDQLVIATVEQGAQALRTMSKTEVWGVIAAAAPAPTTANALQVGLSPDDKLLVWFDGQGLFSYDGTNWLKVFPTTATNVAVEGTCDLIMRGVGSTIFVTRDTSDICTIYEYSIEPTGTVFIAHMSENGMRIWPQGLDVYNGSVWFVARLGSRGNRGILYKKDKLAAPEPIAVLNTNLQTDGQRGLDWAWRCVLAMGDMLWLGGSSREDHSLAFYRIYEDENGITIHPASVLVGVAGPLYSMAVLPSSAPAAFGTERVYCSGTKRTLYKDGEDGADPTADAPAGFVQFPDIDYGAEDRVKQGRFAEGDLLTKSVGGTVEVQYRVDPPTPSSPWTSLGFITVPSTPSTPSPRLPVPDDNAALGLYGQSFRKLQLRTRFTRAASGLVRDIMDTLAYDVVSIRPPGSQ